MRDNYTVGRDPVQQVFHYVKLLRTEKAVPDIKGRAIRGVNTPNRAGFDAIMRLTEVSGFPLRRRGCSSSPRNAPKKIPSRLLGPRGKPPNSRSRPRPSRPRHEICSLSACGAWPTCSTTCITKGCVRIFSVPHHAGGAESNDPACYRQAGLCRK
jgi:hypothetical protein